MSAGGPSDSVNGLQWLAGRGIAQHFVAADPVIGYNGKWMVIETAHLFSCSQISNGVNLIPAVGIKENRRKG
jgi:predicted  nucleic acid-binding Zn ribbon protein